MAADGPPPATTPAEGSAAAPQLPLMPKDTAEGKHTWRVLPASEFKVRGPAYLTDKVKVTHKSAAPFQLVGVESFRAVTGRVEHIAQVEGSVFQRLRAEGDTRFFLIVVYQGAGTPKEHLVLYFALPDNAWAADGPLAELSVGVREAVEATWQRFLHGDSDYRKARWKVIPGVPEGAWVVQNAFGNTPTLLANKLVHTWHSSTEPAIPTSTKAGFEGAGGEGSGTASPGGTPGTGSQAPKPTYGQYLEVDCDVASSSMAKMLVDLLLAHATGVVINLGFLVEAQGEDELPEHVLAAAQIGKVHLDRMPIRDVGNLDRQELKEGGSEGGWASWLGLSTPPAK